MYYLDLIKKMNYRKIPATNLLVLLITLSTLLFASSGQAQTYACVVTNVGDFCMELHPEEAPNTVANFINYIEDGDYNDTMIHRSVLDFVIQGGGFYYETFEEVPKKDPVINEFNISNIRGTVAMAKLPTDPNSATSEWFVNLENNGTGGAALDSQNEGFTVFATIVGAGMQVVDKIARLERVDLTASILNGEAFGSVPVISNSGSGIGSEDLVQVLNVFLTDDPDVAITLPEPDLECPANPVGVETTADFIDERIILPVRVGNSLFQIFFLPQEDSSPLKFRVKLNNVISLIDVGQNAATYNGSTGILGIPSIGICGTVFTDIQFELTNTEFLEFTLLSFSPL